MVRRRDGFARGSGGTTDGETEFRPDRHPRTGPRFPVRAFICVIRVIRGSVRAGFSTADNADLADCRGRGPERANQSVAFLRSVVAVPHLGGCGIHLPGRFAGTCQVRLQ